MKRKWDKKRGKFHAEAVNKIAERLEISGIKGISLERLVHQPIKFPEIRKKGQETGDLIFIWSSAPKEWEISILEVTSSFRRPAKRDWTKLNWTFDFLKNHWQEWFKSIGLSLPEGYTLWIRTASLSYLGRAPWEQPFVIQERRRKIF